MFQFFFSTPLILLSCANARYAATRNMLYYAYCGDFIVCFLLSLCLFGYCLPEWSHTCKWFSNEIHPTYWRRSFQCDRCCSLSKKIHMNLKQIDLVSFLIWFSFEFDLIVNKSKKWWIDLKEMMMRSSICKEIYWSMITAVDVMLINITIRIHWKLLSQWFCSPNRHSQLLKRKVKNKIDLNESFKQINCGDDKQYYPPFDVVCALNRILLFFLINQLTDESKHEQHSRTLSATS